MPYTHFQMKRIKSVLTLIIINFFMVNIDTKDAYYFLPLALEHQKYLVFVYNENFTNIHAC